MTTSTWTSTAQTKKYPKLDKDIEADVCIIGGGITGITAAYMLATKGKSVVLIDKGELSQSTTAFTTAFVTQVVDTGLSEMSRMYGDATAKDVWQSHGEAIDMIEKIIKKEKIECEFMRVSNYMYANDAKEWEGLEKEADAAKKFGFDVEKLHDAALKIRNAGYAEVKNQAKFHPLKYADALKEIAEKAGAQIFDHTEAEEIAEGSPAIIKTSGGTITAKHALIATYQPFNNPKEVFAHKGMYVSYVMELSVPSGSLLEGTYEDEENPYHYFRVDKGPDRKLSLRDRVILGGRDHRHELPLNEEKAFSALEEYWKEIAPGVEYSVIAKWSGPILEPSDGLALIGTYNEKYPGVFLATAFSGNGMTYSMIAAKMFADFVLGEKNEWKKLYAPTRELKTGALWQKGKDYAEEFMRGYAKDVFQSPDNREEK